VDKVLAHCCLHRRRHIRAAGDNLADQGFKRDHFADQQVGAMCQLSQRGARPGITAIGDRARAQIKAEAERSGANLFKRKIVMGIAARGYGQRFQFHLLPVHQFDNGDIGGRIEHCCTGAEPNPFLWAQRGDYAGNNLVRARRAIDSDRGGKIVHPAQTQHCRQPANVIPVQVADEDRADLTRAPVKPSQLRGGAISSVDEDRQVARLQQVGRF
jgi:hypothetical protein